MAGQTESSVTLIKDSDKKHSVLFKATEKDKALDSLYLKRPFADGLTEITVTVKGVK
jgi:hypothetical protein